MLNLKQSVISGGILQRPEIPNFTKFRSAFLEFLHLDGRTERRKEQKYRLLSFHSRTPPNSRTVNVYCCRLLLTKRHSACHVHHLTLQHIYCTNTVQTVQSATELYLQ